MTRAESWKPRKPDNHFRNVRKKVMVCIHGKLARQCEICELSQEVCILREQLNLAYIYSAALARSVWETHWQDESPDFELCDSVPGIISQIDNMVCDLRRA